MITVPAGCPAGVVAHVGLDEDGGGEGDGEQVD